MTLFNIKKNSHLTRTEIIIYKKKNRNYIKHDKKQKYTKLSKFCFFEEASN